MDREKVIERLQKVSHYFKSMLKVGFDGDADIYREHRESIKMAIALLKEQEAVAPVLDEQTGRIWLCGNCGSYVGFEDNDPHDPNEFDQYCRGCGRPVDWFCADGERRSDG